ncbi:substrate-binding domain-containing protein [Pseudomonas aeruginosa]
MTSSDAATIRVAVVGDWVPSQLADVLALQRSQEPETTAALVACSAAEPARAPSPGSRIDFAVSMIELDWPGWVCEPLWTDRLAVAVAKRSHLLAYREVPRNELPKQPVICAQSTAREPWDAVVHCMLVDTPQDQGSRVSTFDMAMTLVAAGYGIAIAPVARLAGYQCRGIAMRPLANAPTIVMAYLLHPCASLAGHQQRFARRARLMSGAKNQSAEQPRLNKAGRSE